MTTYSKIVETALIICCLLYFIQLLCVSIEYESSVKCVEEQKITIDRLTKENRILKDALKALQGSTPGIYKPHIQQIVHSTLLYLGEKNINSWNKLLCLTIATESDMGKYTKQLKGPAKGITQVEPTTEKYALKWLAKHDKKMFSLLKTLRVPANVGIHEAEYNLAYSIGLAYSVYRMKGVNPVGKSIEDLAKLYKKYYNTSKGKATVNNVLTKLVAYGVKL